VTLAELLVLSVVHRRPGIHLGQAAGAVLQPPLAALDVSVEAARNAIDVLRQRRALVTTPTASGLELRLTAAGAQVFRGARAALQQIANAALTAADT
jgi:hypothetical protein